MGYMGVCCTVVSTFWIFRNFHCEMLEKKLGDGDEMISWGGACFKIIQWWVGKSNAGDHKWKNKGHMLITVEAGYMGVHYTLLLCRGIFENFSNTLKKNFFCFYFLAAPRGMWDLSSTTRVWIQALCIGSAESKPLDHQGSPLKFFKIEV